MVDDNSHSSDAIDEQTLFSAVITQHRSLGSTGFLVLMVTIGSISFVAGMMFLILGAWPVFGFFGLEVALVYWAFRANYRAARAYEEVKVTANELIVRNSLTGRHIGLYELAPYRAQPELVHCCDENGHIPGERLTHIVYS